VEGASGGGGKTPYIVLGRGSDLLYQFILLNGFLSKFRAALLCRIVTVDVE